MVVLRDAEAVTNKGPFPGGQSIEKKYYLQQQQQQALLPN